MEKLLPTIVQQTPRPNEDLEQSYLLRLFGIKSSNLAIKSEKKTMKKLSHFIESAL